MDLILKPELLVSADPTFLEAMTVVANDEDFTIPQPERLLYSSPLDNNQRWRSQADAIETFVSRMPMATEDESDAFEGQ